jgi:beta-lactamase superfamily II metal-dependent hydrolase
MKTLLSLAIAAMFGLGAVLNAQTAPAGDKDALRIYFVDVEGGKATLFVTPEHESLLIDTGYPLNDGRDADRIVAMCKRAGVAKIDNLLITHYHRDHAGGVPQLVARIPVVRFIDHGMSFERGDKDPNSTAAWEGYKKTLAENHYERLTVHPGDVLPIKGIHAEVVSADGFLTTKPLKGGGAGEVISSACAQSVIKPVEATENDRSVGLVITFGKLRILDLGDLTWAKERVLECPVDKLGKVDVYIASHHGLARSNSPALLNAVAPRIVVIGNGPTKGDEPTVYDTIQKSPRIVAVWQLHAAENNDAAHNVPEERIANLRGPDEAHGLEMTARKDGTLAMTNERTGRTVEYPAAK